MLPVLCRYARPGRPGEMEEKKEGRTTEDRRTIKAKNGSPTPFDDKLPTEGRSRRSRESKG